MQLKQGDLFILPIKDDLSTVRPSKYKAMENEDSPVLLGQIAFIHPDEIAATIVLYEEISQGKDIKNKLPALLNKKVFFYYETDKTAFTMRRWPIIGNAPIPGNSVMQAYLQNGRSALLTENSIYSATDQPFMPNGFEGDNRYHEIVSLELAKTLHMDNEWVTPSIVEQIAQYHFGLIDWPYHPDFKINYEVREETSLAKVLPKKYS